MPMGYGSKQLQAKRAATEKGGRKPTEILPLSVKRTLRELR